MKCSGCGGTGLARCVGLRRWLGLPRRRMLRNAGHSLLLLSASGLSDLLLLLLSGPPLRLRSLPPVTVARTKSRSTAAG